MQSAEATRQTKQDKTNKRNKRREEKRRLLERKGKLKSRPEKKMTPY